MDIKGNKKALLKWITSNRKTNESVSMLLNREWILIVPDVISKLRQYSINENSIRSYITG